ncbi:hypothetical protein Poli38472_012605 [Pythium oligandrum]|uniref:Uncharacterized protein n=1 Tax=Pythium oligandrum TaxID=41045 RepID=A0A8K1CE74_PYTOL|nr:hypothetical protein Poli38472_012605 [Pythium oligandrum]|eukprot:TMW61414.1 hypothetical protein Poli38472_012605 [Pythium oligandrum]
MWTKCGRVWTHVNRNERNKVGEGAAPTPAPAQPEAPKPAAAAPAAAAPALNNSEHVFASPLAKKVCNYRIVRLYQTALVCRCRKGDLAPVKLLLGNGTRDNLAHITEHCIKLHPMDTWTWLRSYWNKKRICADGFDFGRTAPHKADREGDCRRDKNGLTQLHVAASRVSFKMTSFLLEHGADMDASDEGDVRRTISRSNEE